MGRGGKRTGAGRKKGHKEQRTLAKDLAREALRVKLTREMDAVADALLSRARGVRYFVTRNKKTGKFELVTDAERIVDALNSEDDESGEFYTDKPDTAAIKEIFDRMVDKSKEPEQDVNHKGTIRFLHE